MTTTTTKQINLEIADELVRTLCMDTLAAIDDCEEYEDRAIYFLDDGSYIEVNLVRATGGWNHKAVHTM